MTQEEISPQRLAALLSDRTARPLLILDVREPWEWEIAHIEGATHLPMHLIPLQHNALPDETLIAVVCHHGVRSLQVTRFLRDVGFEQVFSLQGGLEAWASEIDPSMPRY